MELPDDRERQMMMRVGRFIASMGLMAVIAASCGDSAPVSLDASDRSQIMAAAAAERIGILPDQITLVDVVNVVGRSDDGYVRFDDSAPLTDIERAAIVAAIAPAAVQFVHHDDIDASQLDLSHVAIQLAEPEIVEGRVVVTSAIVCGELCGQGGAYYLDTNDGGNWTVTGAPLENQWES